MREEKPNEILKGKIDRVKKDLVKLHDYNPMYVFLTETSALAEGYAIKEAWRTAYPNDPLPKFYRVDPRTLIAMQKEMEEGRETPEVQKDREALENFFKKRIKDRGARIFIYDEFCETGRSSEAVMKFLKYPERYNLDPSLKCENVRMVTPSDPRYLQEKRVISEFCLPQAKEIKAPYSAATRIGAKFTEKTTGAGQLDYRNQIGSDRGLRARILRKKDFESLAYQTRKTAGGIKDPDEKEYFERLAKAYENGGTSVVRFSKDIGREAGQELHAELEKKKKLEQIVSGVVGIFGLVSSFFFLGSSVTGNSIGSLGKSSGSWFGIGLFLVGIAGAVFWFRSKKR